MIKTVSGDILLTEAQAIVHGIAPNDHFNQGLALSLREYFPAMAKDFRHYCHTQSPKAGTAWLWAGAEKVIINLLTQDASENENSHPGRATLSHVGHSLRILRQIIEKEKIRSIALPRLATGVGGLAWNDVRALIEQHLGDLHIPVLIYETYAKGQKAQENLASAA